MSTLFVISKQGKLSYKQHAVLSSHSDFFLSWQRTYFSFLAVVPQPNKEWKPKSSVRPSANSPGVIGSSKSISIPADNPKDLKIETAQVQENMSQLNLFENRNVIIAAHIRVSEKDRSRLTFGSLGTELDASVNSICITAEGAEELSAEPSGRFVFVLSRSYSSPRKGVFKFYIFFPKKLNC